MVARRASSVFSRGLSLAKPPERLLPPEMFPDRESSILLRDDSSGNIRFGLLSVGIASLNRRLNLDYPLSGIEISVFRFQLAVFSWQPGAVGAGGRQPALRVVDPGELPLAPTTGV